MPREQPTIGKRAPVSIGENTERQIRAHHFKLFFWGVAKVIHNMSNEFIALELPMVWLFSLPKYQNQ